MSINHLVVMCKRSLPSKARSRGNFYYIMNYSMYIHALREMTAHLTRVQTQYVTTKLIIGIYSLYNTI